LDQNLGGEDTLLEVADERAELESPGARSGTGDVARGARRSAATNRPCRAGNESIDKRVRFMTPLSS
jgi:hypothetical protein